MAELRLRWRRPEAGTYRLERKESGTGRWLETPFTVVKGYQDPPWRIIQSVDTTPVVVGQVNKLTDAQSDAIRRAQDYYGG